tara:strand:- start:3491 stop:3952 length:462 start_codon:yes stop_codon:yes gene_type:complete
MHLSNFGRFRFIDCTGEVPVYVYEDGTRLKEITLGGAKMPFKFDVQLTTGLIHETRTNRLIEQNIENGIFVFTLVFQSTMAKMRFDTLLLKSFSDVEESNIHGVKFIGTQKQCIDYWKNLIKKETFVKQDFERIATPEECVKYYKNNKEILFL